MMQKLFSAQFWMAIMFSFSCCYGFLIGKIGGEQFLTIVMAVVTFYFVRQRNQTGGIK